MKLPYLQLYTGEWMKDPCLSLCSPSTRGIWIDLCCAIHELDHGGQITGTAEQLSRPCRCSVAEFVNAAAELRQTTTADITDRNGVYTIVCRRIRRDLRLRRIRAEAGRKGGLASFAQAKPRPKPEPNTEDDTDNESSDRGKEGSGEPSGAPCSIDDCVNQSNFIGLPTAEAEKFWNHYEAIGWRLGGSIIRNWKPLLAKWRMHWETTRTRPNRDAEPKRESIWEKTKRVDLITEEIEQIRTRGGSDGNGGYNIRDHEKERYAKLLAERKRLKTEIKGVE